jgi:ribosomal protein S18
LPELIACIADMIWYSGSRMLSAIITPALRMMPRKITAIDITRREITPRV